ncbi:hypothetical protein [Atlanticothrix silvestris]|uniref:hypothetical protein n=1 Tax=Atlanticothrix silvestris TaxID=2840444 RepID=UPI001BDC7884|nr:hypothetical protein [Atlanticothrix silvestris]
MFLHPLPFNPLRVTLLRRSKRSYAAGFTLRRSPVAHGEPLRWTGSQGTPLGGYADLKEVPPA